MNVTLNGSTLVINQNDLYNFSQQFGRTVFDQAPQCEVIFKTISMDIYLIIGIVIVMVFFILLDIQMNKVKSDRLFWRNAFRTMDNRYNALKRKYEK